MRFGFLRLLKQSYDASMFLKKCDEFDRFIKDFNINALIFFAEQCFLIANIMGRLIMYLL